MYFSSAPASLGDIVYKRLSGFSPCLTSTSTNSPSNQESFFETTLFLFPLPTLFLLHEIIGNSIERTITIPNALFVNTECLSPILASMLCIKNDYFGEKLTLLSETQINYDILICSVLGISIIYILNSYRTLNYIATKTIIHQVKPCSYNNGKYDYACNNYCNRPYSSVL